MKIALVCPHFPPDHCGVGDQTYHLAAELESLGHRVSVLTARLAPKNLRGVEVVSVPAPWGPRALALVTAKLKKLAPDAVLIQFTPYLYAPHAYGMSALLPPWIIALKKTVGAPISVFCHEPYYPVGFTPERLLVGWPQFGIFHAIVAAADHVFFSIQAWRDQVAKRMPWTTDRLTWRPVGPGISLRRIDRALSPRDEAEVLRTARVPERHALLVQFGGTHPTRIFGDSFAAYDRVRKELGPDSASLVFVGAESEFVERELERAGRMDLKSFVRGTGFVADWQAVAWLRRSSLVLAPFVDGVSTRRSSVISALILGRPVVSTRGYHTDAGFPWDEVAALSAPNTDAFAARALSLIKNTAEAERLARAAASISAERLDWEGHAREVASILGSLA